MYKFKGKLKKTKLEGKYWFILAGSVVESDTRLIEWKPKTEADIILSLNSLGLSRFKWIKIKQK